MPRTDGDRTIALAALFQTTHMVRDIARTGGYDGDDFATCIESLFKIDADSSEAVYGNLRRLKIGLRLVAEQLRQPQDMEITRYTLNLMVLERKLGRRPDLLAKLRRDIVAIESRLEHFPATHDNIVAALAELYSNTISTLSPRIKVEGEKVFLSQQDNANRIRALLLAGIRAAILWRQSGGSRLTLVLKRRALLETSRRMLARLDSSGSGSGVNS